ncbi:DUF2207 domain-containing protein [Candidatus Omnitrophota bacterium]
MMKRVLGALCISIAAVAFLISLPTPVEAQRSERILSFHSDIQVHQDASMTVTETIKVISAGDRIKRGIYRDFPTHYKDRFGNNVVVDFRVQQVLRDGVAEKYHIERMSNGKRVYIGSKNVYLSAGEYTYTLVYTTNRQLGFFDDFDELYWNVTGNDWEFAIEQASAAVHLPAGISSYDIKLDGYTGGFGSKQKDFTASADTFEGIVFTTTRRLSPQQGLTIVVSWPKGYVDEPTRQEKLGFFFKDNSGVILGIVGILLLFGYYLVVWSMVGKDPQRGVIIPLYQPPKQFSPAAMRYIMNMGFDHKAFSAAVINMAVKGYITIQDSNGVFTLKKTGAEKSILTAEEKVIDKILLGRGGQITLKNTKHLIVIKGLNMFKDSLKTRFERTYFFTNKQYFFPAAGISLFLVVASGALNAGEKFPIAVFMCVWLTFWSFGTTTLLSRVVSLWKGVRVGAGGQGSSFGKALALTLFSAPFVFGMLFGFSMLGFATSPSVIVLLAAVVTINIIFYRLLKAPTITGRKVMDTIEGFKMYLSVAEKERLNMLNPPDKTPELFEQYLPYALALDVENAWAAQFSEVFKQIQGTDRDYSPTWYSGSSWRHLGAGGFSSGLGSGFTNSISSASVAPGSSSGGGGGGSSGGGGGGGGGGGW